MDLLLQAEELVKRLAAAVRSHAVYGGGHPIAQRAVATLVSAVDEHFRHAPHLTMAFLGDDVLIERTRLRASSNLQSLVRRFHELQVEKLSLSKGLTAEEIGRLVGLIADRTERPFAERLSAAALRGVGIGLLEPLEPTASNDLGLVAARHVYAAAMAAADRVWHAAVAGEEPDTDAARILIDAMAQSVSQDRTSMLALTSIKTHDPYTFTHMINVALLTMAQARSLGLGNAMVREFGLAGLMHDVGKSRIPSELLTKPGALTAEERLLMQRHVVDGAQILRKTPGMPALAPVVAFEHHLRLDGSGYPEGVGARRLNLCTMLVAIADVYDALRSNRAYREGLPTERVRHILSELSGKAFEPTLLRRFITMMGLFPPGSFVRLTNDAIAVVIEEHPDDIHHPVVRVLFDRHGERQPGPVMVDTSQRSSSGQVLVEIAEALDADSMGVSTEEVFV